MRKKGEGRGDGIKASWELDCTVRLFTVGCGGSSSIRSVRRLGRLVAVQRAFEHAPQLRVHQLLRVLLPEVLQVDVLIVRLHHRLHHELVLVLLVRIEDERL